MLNGNSPRFSWQPSTTMLINRLSGTTEASVSNRTGRDKSRPLQWQTPPRSIFCRHGVPGKALGC